MIYAIFKRYVLYFNEIPTLVDLKSVTDKHYLSEYFVLTSVTIYIYDYILLKK